MKALIVTCFESNEERISFVLDSFKKKRYNTKVITTNYSHIKKEYRTNTPEEYIAIDTKPYTKNISIKRIISHIKFAKDAFKKIELETPDIIWLMAPANYLIKEANKYKKKYPATKIIIDIVDMWPESLPIRINKNIFPFNIWRNIRKNNIKCADALVTECDYYQEILKTEYLKNITTIHWARDNKAIETKLKPNGDKLSLCYIGSINNIIDTKTICEVISNCDKPVVLHVIGNGENRYNFIETVGKMCEVIYHGEIRDEKEKNKIFSECHAGINIYKENLYIGLTVKSIDYFEHGLPVINNIKGDTWNLINKYNAGINYYSNATIDSNMLIDLRKNNKKIYELYNQNFTKGEFINNCINVINGVIKK